MKLMKLNQNDVDAGCKAAADRYLALPPQEAATAFAYEVNAYLAVCVKHGGMKLDEAIIFIIDLLMTIRCSNRRSRAHSSMRRSKKNNP